VQKKDQVALFGPSGSGKSTFLHVLAGLLPATKGRVMVCGHSLEDMSEAERDRFRSRYIGYIYQNFNLLQGYTALENVLILNKEEDYQLMQGALEAKMVSGSHQSLRFLHSKVEAWLDTPNGIGTNPGPGDPTIYYKLLMIKANSAILFIDSRWKRAQQ
jgi:predicted ABC-type transport system involved in lysophospholipase L1 biosynthesis ATPase subunit